MSDYNCTCQGADYGAPLSAEYASAYFRGTPLIEEQPHGLYMDMRKLLLDLKRVLVREYNLIGETPETPQMKQYSKLIDRIDRALAKLKR